MEPGAHQTDAYQKVRNLLLSDEAEANSMPGLEILADDVRCTHGATSGQIDEEEFFYMLARGIPPKQARQLIVFGFLNEVIERLGNEAIAEELRALVSRKFAAICCSRGSRRGAARAELLLCRRCPGQLPPLPASAGPWAVPVMLRVRIRHRHGL